MEGNAQEQLLQRPSRDQRPDAEAQQHQRQRGGVIQQLPDRFDQRDTAEIQGLKEHRNQQHRQQRRQARHRHPPGDQAQAGLQYQHQAQRRNRQQRRPYLERPFADLPRCSDQINPDAGLADVLGVLADTQRRHIGAVGRRADDTGDHQQANQA